MYPALVVRLTLCAFGVLAVAASNASAQVFLPGEILVNNFGNATNPTAPNVQRYSPAGGLVQTYTGSVPGTGPGTVWRGASLTPDGNLATTYASPNDTTTPGVNIFRPDGSLLITFPAPGVGNGVTTGRPGDVSVFADGTLAIASQNANQVAYYSQSGTLLRQVPLAPGVNAPLGSTVGGDNVLYVTGRASFTLSRLTQDGTVLGTATLGFAPGDVAWRSDGTLYVSSANDGQVKHITPDGVVLDSFPTGLSGEFDGLALGPDGNSLYATTSGSSVVRHFDLAGTPLGDFTIGGANSPTFLTVVPVPEPTGLLAVAAAVAVAAAGVRRPGRVGTDRRADHGGLEPARVTFLHWYRAWPEGAFRQLRG